MDRLFVHRNGKRAVVGVGFNWWCFFFGGFYGLVTAQWFVFLAHLGLNVLFFLLGLEGCPPLALSLTGFGTNFIIAFQCNTWRVETLLEQGYEQT